MCASFNGIGICLRLNGGGLMLVQALPLPFLVLVGPWGSLATVTDSLVYLDGCVAEVIVLNSCWVVCTTVSLGVACSIVLSGVCRLVSWVIVVCDRSWWTEIRSRYFTSIVKVMRCRSKVS